MNNFNGVAPIYDFLARFVFGNTILKSQVYYLDEIKDGDSVLIIGGGTGRLLEYVRAKNVAIDYIEPSDKMVERAKKRNFRPSINFYKERFEDFKDSRDYDIIICPFFLDLFSEATLNETLSKIKGLLSKKGKVIVTDFSSHLDSWYSKILLRLMHLFFRWTASLESKMLFDIHKWVLTFGFEECRSQYFYIDLIFSKVYKIK
ncbi:MAG: class I SAM-dependent methyltransferase [Reichenbachiella sp.]